MKHTLNWRSPEAVSLTEKLIDNVLVGADKW